jgi:hypothetical protein
VLVQEIFETVSENGTLLGGDPQETAYRVGQFELYQSILALQSGELIDDR